jgi:hypothetical protein
MKTKILLSFLLFICIAASAQLRIDPYGRIGIGTNYPNPGYKVHIKGDLLLTTYPEIPPPNQSPVELRFRVGNGSPGAEIGTGVGKIAFWDPTVGYNKLYAEAFYWQSDSSTKTDITAISNSLQKIKSLKAYSYFLKDSRPNDRKMKYGFLAQEIEKVLPNIVDSAKGILMIDGFQILPLLVEAMKEQQITIDSIKQQLTATNNEMIRCCNQHQQGTTEPVLKESDARQGIHPLPDNPTTNHSSLYQNKPNPFANETIIEFDVAENFNTASIMIFDLQGTLKDSKPIYLNGKGQIKINNNMLASGMYLYSLVIDGKEIDTKRMILVN